MSIPTLHPPSFGQIWTEDNQRYAELLNEMNNSKPTFEKRESSTEILAKAFRLATQQGLRVKKIRCYDDHVEVEYFEEPKEFFFGHGLMVQVGLLEKELKYLNPMNTIIHISRKLWEAMPEGRSYERVHWAGGGDSGEEVLYNGFRMKISDDPELESFRVERVDSCDEGHSSGELVYVNPAMSSSHHDSFYKSVSKEILVFKELKGMDPKTINLSRSLLDIARLEHEKWIGESYETCGLGKGTAFGMEIVERDDLNGYSFYLEG